MFFKVSSHRCSITFQTARFESSLIRIIFSSTNSKTLCFPGPRTSLQGPPSSRRATFATSLCSVSIRYLTWSCFRSTQITPNTPHFWFINWTERPTHVVMLVSHDFMAWCVRTWYHLSIWFRLIIWSWAFRWCGFIVASHSLEFNALRLLWVDITIFQPGSLNNDRSIILSTDLIQHMSNIPASKASEEPQHRGGTFPLLGLSERGCPSLRSARTHERSLQRYFYPFSLFARRLFLLQVNQ